MVITFLFAKNSHIIRLFSRSAPVAFNNTQIQWFTRGIVTNIVLKSWLPLGYEKETKLNKNFDVRLNFSSLGSQRQIKNKFLEERWSEFENWPQNSKENEKNRGNYQNQLKKPAENWHQNWIENEKNRKNCEGQLQNILKNGYEFENWHQNRRENKNSRKNLAYSSFLALSLFGSKTEGDKEKKESELITMIKRGILALKNGELNKAEQLLHIALRNAQESSNDQAVTYIFDLLANLAYQRDEYSKAEKLFKDVLQRMLSGGMEPNDNAVVEISLKLASVYASMLDYEKAVQGFQFCIATQEDKIEKYGENNLDEDTLLLWAMSMDWYARFLLNIHKFDLAKQHFIKAYEMSMRVHGFGHEQTAVLLNDIGSVCSLQKQYPEAVQYFEKAIASARESKSADIGSFYINLGTVYMQQNLMGEAERCCKEGLVLAKKAKNQDAIEEAEICLQEIKKIKTNA